MFFSGFRVPEKYAELRLIKKVSLMHRVRGDCGLFFRLNRIKVKK